MKYLPSIAFEEMSGSAKGVTAAKTRGRKYIRNRGYGGSVRTSGQASVKSVFKMLSQAWQSLTGAQIQAWNNAAQSADAKSVLGTKTRIRTEGNMNATGDVSYYKSSDYPIDILQTPPVLGGVEAPAAATIALSGTAFTLTLASVPEDVSNLKLIICASAPQSNGISNAYAKAAEFITPQTPVTTAIALKTSYDAKYGAPSSGSPKVFIKYFYVNTATGQKSGEMLAEAHLSTSNGSNED